MKAVRYYGPGDRRLEEVGEPRIQDPGDAVVKIQTFTICGTDLHILRGHVPEVRPGTVLGHEAVGVVEEVGPAVRRFRPGDRVLVPAISACGICSYCRKQMYGQCENGGGWVFGHLIDGLHAERARVPFADTSLYSLPAELDDEDVIFLADILPTGYECGIVRGQVRPGCSVAIVGAGPIGLSALLTSRFHGPRMTIVIDLDDNRLELARSLGADHVLNPSRQDVQREVMSLTDGGVDVAIEAVGVPDTFELCTELVRPGGSIANIGVHGSPVTLHLERLWIKDVTITTQLVDGNTIPLLLGLIQSRRLDPRPLATHTFTFDRVLEAYDVFANASQTRACKVLVKIS
ncbi:MAG TPA: zinc-dependent alcohol dehydrogenase family protein [Dehalococcoidia bacterium]|nr:zinc-dependent alcohol dehydrogenase family protein [Dehalococcoidia bacterium]